MTERKDVLRETDADAIRLARTLLRSARHGALAVIDPASGGPLASRVAVATDHDGAPIILVSALSGHTAGLAADPRCSLLLGEPGKGDPLAHPRISIACVAERIARDDERFRRIARRFLSRNPKARLYADFPDFAYFRLEPQRASLNGGFGKAFALSRDELLTSGEGIASIAEAEAGAVDHMNEDHADAVARYAVHYGRSDIREGWVMTGIDADGFDLVSGDRALRIFFETPLGEPADMHRTLVAMAVAARQAEAAGKGSGAAGES